MDHHTVLGAVRRRAVPTVPTAAALLLGTTALLAPGTTATAAAAATPGSTAVVDPVYGRLAFDAAPGEANKVVLKLSWPSGASNLTYDISDAFPIAAGNGCTRPVASDTRRVVCLVPAQDSEDPYNIATFNLGDENDSMIVLDSTNGHYYFSTINGGPGNDTVSDTMTSSSDSVIYGNSGNDTITTSGNSDNDYVSGGPGNDRLIGLPRESTGGVDLYGGPGNDTIEGGKGPDYLYGGPGNDTITSGPGNDLIYGNSGNDTIYGNSGNDTISGGPGNDRISGGPGTNHIKP